MRKLYGILVASMLITSFIPVNAMKELQKEEVMIVLEEKKSLSKTIGDLGNKVEKMKNAPIVTGSFTKRELAELAKKESIIAIEPMITIKKTEETSSKPINKENDIRDWGVNMVQATESWDKGYTGKGVKVAVIDTGIDIHHEDLQVKGGESFISYTDSYNDDDGHGTHVAGTISAEHNGIGMKGIAPDIDLYALKVLDNQGGGSIDGLVKAIDWSITNKMDIINMSLGTPSNYKPLELIIQKANDAGIIMIASAGNNGNEDGTGETMLYPAKFPNVISVGAIDHQKKRAEFSSTGENLVISAPGHSILSTYPDNRYVYMSGTSMAVPHVTGIFALYKDANLTLTNQQIKEKVISRVEDLGKKGQDHHFGFGLVKGPIDPTPPPPLEKPQNFQAKEIGPNFITLTWDEKESRTFELKRGNIVLYKGEKGEFTDKNLSPDQMYYYEIAVYKNDEKQEVIGGIFKTNHYPALEKIKFLEKTSTSTTTTLKWQHHKDYQYKLYRNGKLIYSGNKNTFKDQKLSAQTNYRYQLYQIDPYGQKNNTTFVIKTKPKPIPILKVTKVDKSSVTLQWTNIKGVTYVLKRDGKIIYRGTATAYKNSKLSPNKLYTYTVQAVVNNESSDVKSIQVRTKK